MATKKPQPPFKRTASDNDLYDAGEGQPSVGVTAVPANALGETVAGMCEHAVTSATVVASPDITYESVSDFYDSHCTYLPAMVGWFVASSLLSSYNKYVFGEDHLHFPCPLLVTSIHFFVQWLFSWSVCQIFPETMGLDRVRNMSWTEWLAISLPCGWVTSGDIGLSNLSVVTISITFYTMVKASTPIFVLVWAYLFGIEKITWSLLGVICIIAAGELLTVYGEVHFDLKGFVLCLTASMLSGARWTLVQLKLQSMEPPLKTTIVTMRFLAPSMFFSMLLLSLLIERPLHTLRENVDIEAQFAELMALGALGGALAVSMILCEFYLILKASAIILMIGGVIKELITIFIGVHFFRDHLNATNLTGCGIVFIGVVCYKIMFHLQKHENNVKESAPTDSEDTMRLIVTSSKDDEDSEMTTVQRSGRGVELVHRNHSSGNSRKIPGVADESAATVATTPSDEDA